MNDRPFIVDYLSLIRPPNFSYSHAADLLDKLTAMARDLNVTIICNDKPFNVHDGGESVYHPSAKLVRLVGKSNTGIWFRKLRKMPLH